MAAMTKTATNRGSAEAAKASGMPKIAAILLRGTVKAPHDVIDTINFLKLYRKNHCVLYPKTPAIEGMLRKVKDYITWGQISDVTVEQLFQKRGLPWHGPLKDSKEQYAYTHVEYNGKMYKPYFRLNPPRKGFGRKGIKVAFRAGGGLGDRAEHMNDLILRML